MRSYMRDQPIYNIFWCHTWVTRGNVCNIQQPLEVKSESRPGKGTRSKKLLVAPGITTRNEKLLVTLLQVY